MLIQNDFPSKNSLTTDSLTQEPDQWPAALAMQTSSTQKMCGCAPATSKFTSLLPMFQKSDQENQQLNFNNTTVGQNEQQENSAKANLVVVHSHQFEAAGYPQDYFTTQHDATYSSSLQNNINTSDQYELDRVSISAQYDLDSSLVLVSAQTSEQAAPAFYQKIEFCDNEDATSFLSVEDYPSALELSLPNNEMSMATSTSTVSCLIKLTQLPVQTKNNKFNQGIGEEAPDYLESEIPSYENNNNNGFQDLSQQIGSGLMSYQKGADNGGDNNNINIINDNDHDHDDIQVGHGLIQSESQYPLVMQPYSYNSQTEDEQNQAPESSFDQQPEVVNPSNLNLTYQGTSNQYNYSENCPDPAQPISWETLRTPMIDLLLLFYNKEATANQPGLLIDNLTPVIDILQKWNSKDLLSASSLLNFMIDQVAGIVNEVRNKLLYRACYRFKIIEIKLDPTSAGCPDDELEEQDLLKVLTYDQKPGAFDRFIYSLWKYLDMLTRTAEQIEDLYLTFLEQLGLQRPNKYTVFKAVHWQAFRNVVLRDALIRRILDTIEEWRDSGHATNEPGKWLDRVRSIRKLIPSAAQSYFQYECEYGRSELLQQACSIAMHPIKMKQYSQEEDELTEQLKNQVQQELKGYYSDEAENDNDEDDDDDDVVVDYNGMGFNQNEFEATSDQGIDYYQIPVQQSTDQDTE